MDGQKDGDTETEIDTWTVRKMRHGDRDRYMDGQKDETRRQR